MTKPWDPDPETLTEVRRRLLGDESSRDVAQDHPVHRATLREYARGEKGTDEADIGPIRSAGSGSQFWFWQPGVETETETEVSADD